MADDKYPPALTREEWDDRRAGFGRYAVSLHTYADDGGELQVCSDLGQETWTHVPVELMPQATALCLQHAAPDGGPLFTWSDVALLRIEADIIRTNATLPGEPEDALALDDLAARIASLLPPEDL